MFKEERKDTAEMMENHKTNQLAPYHWTCYLRMKLYFTLIEEGILNKEFCPDNELEEEKQITSI